MIYSCSNFQMCRVLLTVATMPNITPPGLIYFITGSLYILTLPILFSHSHLLPLVTTNLFYELVLLLFFLNSIYKWNRMVFILLCLTWFSIVSERSTRVFTNGRISSFSHGWIVFHFVRNTHTHTPTQTRLLYPFIHWWTFMLLPCLSFCK